MDWKPKYGMSDRGVAATVIGQQNTDVLRVRIGDGVGQLDGGVETTMNAVDIPESLRTPNSMFNVVIDEEGLYRVQLTLGLDTLAESWKRFCEAAKESHSALAFGPCKEMTQLAEVFPEVASHLFGSYPKNEIRVGGALLFPSPEALRAFRAELAGSWPRHWMPVSMVDHLVYFISSREVGVQYVYLDDGDPIDNACVGYATLSSFLQAATATLLHIDDDAFEMKSSGKFLFRQSVRVLKDEVQARVAEDSCPKDEGPSVLPWMS